jgi:hypothetical protein
VFLRRIRGCVKHRTERGRGTLVPVSVHVHLSIPSQAAMLCLTMGPSCPFAATCRRSTVVQISVLPYKLAHMFEFEPASVTNYGVSLATCIVQTAQL